MQVPILGQTSVPGPAPWITVTVSGTWSGTLQVVSISSPTATYQNLNSQTWNSGSATVTLNASSTGTPLNNPVFSGQLTGNGLAAPNGGSNNDCWPTDGGPGISCAGAAGIGDQIQEFAPFTAQCGTSNGYALMNSAAVATLPAYTEKCLIPFSAVGSGTLAPIVSGSTNIFNECPPPGLFSSVSLASPQLLRVWSNGGNWEASCPAVITASSVSTPVLTKNLVADFNAKADSSTDNCTPLTNAITWLAAHPGGSLYAPYWETGVYKTSCTLDFGAVAHGTIRGEEGQDTVIDYTGSGATAFKLVGTSYLNFEDIGLEADNSSSPPNFIMALGRTSNLVGSDIHFHGVTIYGCATEASFYGVATDGLQFDKGSYIRKTCGGALRVVYLSQSDDLSFGGMTASTSLAMDLSGLDIEDQSSSPSAVPIQIEQGAATSLNYKGGYLKAGNDAVQIIQADASVQGQISFDGTVIEWAPGLSETYAAFHIIPNTVIYNGAMGGYNLTNIRATGPPPSGSGYFLLADSGSNILGSQITNNYGAGSISIDAATGLYLIDGQGGSFSINNHVNQSYIVNTNASRTIADVSITAAYDSTIIDNGNLNAIGKAATLNSLTVTGNVRLGGTLGVSVGATNAVAYLTTSVAGENRDLWYETNNLPRWIARANASSESGSNAGSNYEIQAYSDAGAYIDSPLEIDRAAGGWVILNRIVGINSGTNIVYRCATSGTLPAGALTITAGSCGTTTDTGLRIP